MRNYLLVLVTLLCSLPVVAQENYSTAWSGHRTLHMNATGSGAAISANVLRFPVLVRLGAADSALFAASKLTGADIRFTKANNTTRLQHQIERWDSAGRAAAVWVLVDTVYAGNGAQQVRMHWGNAAAMDSSRAAAVFDTANGYQAVWHMNRPADSSEFDATANNFTARDSNGVAAATGVIGGARSFTGGNGTGGASGTVTDNDALIVDNSATGRLNFPENGNYTLSGWFNPSDADNNRSMITKSDNQYALKMESAAPQRWELQEFNKSGTGIQGWQSYLGSPRTNGVWHHVLGVRSGTTGAIYVNGVLSSTVQGGSASANARDLTANVNLGKRGNTATVATNNNYYAGLMDEVRMENVSRSADYALLSYESQKPGSTFLTSPATPSLSYTVDTIKYEAGYAVPIIPVAPAAFNPGAPAATFSAAPALPAGLTLNAATGVISGAPTAAATGARVITATNTQGTASDTIYLAGVAATENYATGWSGVKTINVNTGAAGAGVTTAQTRYPLLLRLGAADSAVFTAGRASLRFSRPDGARLRYQIDTWDSAGRSASVWVLLDNVAGNGSTPFRIHWGNNAVATQSSGAAVFSSLNGYMGVWHMGDPTGDPITAVRPNAVSPGTNDATPKNFTASHVPKTGVVGMADSLQRINNTADTNGVSDHFDIGDGWNTFGGNATLSMWVAPIFPVANQFVQFLSIGNTVGNAGHNTIWLGRRGSATASQQDDISAEVLGGSVTGGRFDATTTAGALVADQWQHIAFTVSGLDRTLYRNGVLVAGPTAGTQAIRDTMRTRAFIGYSTWPDATMRGRLDEVRVSRTAYPADWMKLDYMTQRPGAMPIANLSYGPAAYTVGAAITANTPALAGTALRYTVAPALPAGLVLDSNTGVISGTPTAVGGGTFTVTAASGAWTTSATVNISVSVGGENYTTNWTQHKTLYVNTRSNRANVTGTVTNFPLLVRLDSARFASVFTQARGNGADIRFTKAGDAVRLPHQIERWDSAGKRAEIWVRVDSVRGDSNNQQFRMHWGNATAVNASSGPETFAAANGFQAVFHLNKAAANDTDATGGYVAIPVGGAIVDSVNPAPANHISGGRFKDFGGVGAYRVATSGGGNTNGSFPIIAGSTATLSAWVKVTAFPAGSGTRTGIISKEQTGVAAQTANTWNLRTTAANQFDAHTSNASAAPDPTLTNAAFASTWTYLTYVRSGNAAEILYAYNAGVPNGVNDAGTTAIATASPTVDVVIGGFAGSASGEATGVGFLNGKIDEVTIANTARSADWVKLSYETQRPGAIAVLDTISPNVVGVAAGRLTAGPSLSFQALDKGLLFQIQGDVAARARLSIVDMQGRTIWNRTVATTAGMNQVVWNGQSNKGQSLGSGVFVVRMALLDADGRVAQRLDRKVPLTR